MPVALLAPAQADLASLLSLLAARERADRLIPGYWQRLVLDQWHNPKFDSTLDAVLATDGEGKMIGAAAVFEPGGFAAVHPDREGQGAGSALLGWIEQRAHEHRHEQHRQLIGDHNASAQALLIRAGYRHVRSYLRLGRQLTGPLEGWPSPDGVCFDHPAVAADGRELHQLDDQAFSGNADYAPHSFEGFWHEHLRPEVLSPELSLVARRGGRIVGMSLCRSWSDQDGVIDLLAVSADERGRGLGRALLERSFAAFAHAGLARAMLDVASDNPAALRLYERAGMEELHRTRVLEKPTV